MRVVIVAADFFSCGFHVADIPPDEKQLAPKLVL
jgi:hypothetical protein